MSTVTDFASNLDEMPRFSDGMINIQELIRLIAEAAINEIMAVQADELCLEQGNSRNGYRDRELVTTAGTLHLRIPKVRIGTFFPSDILERYSRTDKAIVAAIHEMVVNGLSTRKIERVANQLGIDKMSASQVSRICQSLDEIVKELQTRTFESDVTFPYLWLDATYIKARHEGHVSSTAIVSAIGAGSDGFRRVVGIDAIDTESYEGWYVFLSSLRTRGIAGVACITSDAHEGLKKAIEEVFPGAAWQRCIVHLERNACAKATNKKKRALIGSILSAVFTERDPALVKELYHLACDKIEPICKEAAELLEDAEADALAYLDFPYEHHKRLRTNNVQERMNREIKRRSRVVQVFPSRISLLRYIGSVLVELDEEWMEKRWFSKESMEQITEGKTHRKPNPKPSYKGTATEEAKRIIEFIMADGIDGKGKVA